MDLFTEQHRNANKRPKTDVQKKLLLTAENASR